MKVYIVMSFIVMALATVSGEALKSVGAACDAVIPRPAEVIAGEGTFVLNANTRLSGSAAAFAEVTEIHFGLALEIGDNASVRFLLDAACETGVEGYVLTVSEDAVSVKAQTETGLFYGAMTLVQMVRFVGEGLEIPCATVIDQPRFEWRGLMLDEARHFMGKEFVLHLLDTMALHKMNRLHWHLTDDEGWRVEIEGYPKLTEIGAWRGEGSDFPRVKWRKETEGKGPRYGGFYTQDDLREIVAYAKARHIEIVPEIDMPGHVTALLTAYPEVGPIMSESALAEARKKSPNLPTLAASGDSPKAYRKNVMSVVREENYVLCDAIINQLTAIFTYKYWHVGGDEVHPLHWQASANHQALMKEKGFTNPHQLQNMFLLRIEKMLKKRGRTMMGWNEIMKGGQLSPDTAVMAWTGGDAGIKAAKAGYPTVMAVAWYNYFDMAYPGEGENVGAGWAGKIDSKRAYGWNPLFANQLSPEQQQRIMGVQACLWSEYVPDSEDADYKFWPRACSTAEVGWTPQELREWDEYLPRLGKHLRYLDNLGVRYRVAPPKAVLAKGMITLEPGIPGSSIIYTIDGSEPLEGSAMRYAGKALDASVKNGLRCRAIRPAGLSSIVISGARRTGIVEWNMPSKSEKSAVITFDLTHVIDRNGTWGVHFIPDAGKNFVIVEKIVLKQDGKVVFSKNPNMLVKAGGAVIDVPIDGHKAGAVYGMEITMKPVLRERGETGGKIAVDR